jgi:hypothetical protein
VLGEGFAVQRGGKKIEKEIISFAFKRKSTHAISPKSIHRFIDPQVHNMLDLAVAVERMRRFTLFSSPFSRSRQSKGCENEGASRLKHANKASPAHAQPNTSPGIAPAPSGPKQRRVQRYHGMATQGKVGTGGIQIRILLECVVDGRNVWPAVEGCWCFTATGGAVVTSHHITAAPA